MILYHGSKNVIEHPEIGRGNLHNDYGLGFYCTESIDLAKEWACMTDQDGYANQYELDLSSLNVLRLTGGDYHILNWLAILVENRMFNTGNDLASEAKNFLLDQFKPPYEQYDVITGYRADDSYFSFSKAFLNNTISLQKLENAMIYGNLGIQIVLKSEKAFSQLTYRGHEQAIGAVYYPRRQIRDTAARAAYNSARSTAGASDDIYMIDILRGRWKNDDSRLRRIILG